MISQQSIRVAKTAHIIYHGTPDKSTEHLWLIFHGYGQLAGRFIQKFQPLMNADTVLVVPEALNRFYVDNTSGKVGASWMTKEDREKDIQDNHLYLDQLWESIELAISSSCKVHILAFSQGTATACRWLAHKQLAPTSLVLWAGMWPPDVNGENLSNLLTHTKSFMVLGDNDPYANHEMLLKQKELVNSWGIQPEILTFEGKHIIDEDVLIELHKKITSV